MVGALEVSNDLLWSHCISTLLANDDWDLMGSGKQLVFHTDEIDLYVDKT